MQTLSKLIDRLSNFWLCDELRADPDSFRRAKRLAIFNLAFLFWVTLFAVFYAVLGSTACGVVTFSTTFAIGNSLLLLKRGHAPTLCGNVVTLGGYVSLTALAALNGGLIGPSLLWYSVLPVVAVLTAGVFSGMIWTGVCVASLAAFSFAQSHGAVFPQLLSNSSLALFHFEAVLGLLVCQFVMAAVRVVIEQRALAAVSEAKQELAETRRLLKKLEASRGYTAEEWQRITREHAALTRFVRLKYSELDALDPSDADFDDDSSADDSSADDSLDDLSDSDLLTDDSTDDLDSASEVSDTDLATKVLETILRSKT